MDGKNADVIGRETPNSKCMVDGSNAGACTCEDFFLLATCLGLEVSDAARKEIRIHKLTIASAEIQFPFQLLLLESELVSELFLAEGDLTGTAANIKDRRSMFGLDFRCNAKCATTRGRIGTASFVTTRQTVTDSNG